MTHRIGTLEVLAELGRGGMGVVLLARDPSLDRKVAIKLLSPQMAADPELVIRFEREARSAAALNHPNIIAIYQIGEDQGQPYFVMEYVEGESLTQLLRREGRLSPVSAAQILFQAASGLAAAHKRGIVHRDIKPGNIMITPDHLVKLADFGIAHYDNFEKKLTSTGQLLGTLGYLSPEVCLGEKQDARSDLFSLGVVLFEMLSGSTPFSAPSPLMALRAVVENPTPDIRQLNLEVEPELAQILEKLLAKKPEARFQNCDALLSALERFLDGKVRSLGRIQLQGSGGRNLNVDCHSPSALSQALRPKSPATQDTSPTIQGNVAATLATSPNNEPEQATLPTQRGLDPAGQDPTLASSPALEQQAARDTRSGSTLPLPPPPPLVEPPLLPPPPPANLNPEAGVPIPKLQGPASQALQSPQTKRKKSKKGLLFALIFLVLFLVVFKFFRQPKPTSEAPTHQTIASNSETSAQTTAAQEAQAPPEVQTQQVSAAPTLTPEPASAVESDGPVTPRQADKSGILPQAEAPDEILPHNKIAEKSAPPNKTQALTPAVSPPATAENRPQRVMLIDFGNAAEKSEIREELATFLRNNNFIVEEDSLDARAVFEGNKPIDWLRSHAAQSDFLITVRFEELSSREVRALGRTTTLTQARLVIRAFDHKGRTRPWSSELEYGPLNRKLKIEHALLPVKFKIQEFLDNN